MKRSSISLKGGEQWEKIYGFSRAKVIEDTSTEIKQVFISNTSAFNSDGIIQEPENVMMQMEQIIMNMKEIMSMAGGNLNDIVETTFYTTSFDFFPEIAQVHQKYFGEAQPATTLIHVSEMASKDMLVEGSARAIINK
jgi:enamine deaminase RidA (YjgF/YER057c/UK114 family)